MNARWMAAAGPAAPAAVASSAPDLDGWERWYFGDDAEAAAAAAQTHGAAHETPQKAREVVLSDVADAWA